MTSKKQGKPSSYHSRTLACQMCCGHGDLSFLHQTVPQTPKTRATAPVSRPGSATLLGDWVPVVATGAALFMIVLDTSIANLARIGTELSSGTETSV